jgi:hypothetical protein
MIWIYTWAIVAFMAYIVSLGDFSDKNFITTAMNKDIGILPIAIAIVGSLPYPSIGVFIFDDIAQ